MSRLIQTRSEVHDANKLSESSSGDYGRLIIYRDEDHFYFFHIQSGRLTAIKQFSVNEQKSDIILARVCNIKNDIGAVFVKIDENTDAFLKMTNIPKKMLPLKQGDLIPVSIKSDSQKGKLISVTAKVNKRNLPDGWQYKSAFNVLYKSEFSLKSIIDSSFDRLTYEKIITEDEEIYNLLLKEEIENVELYRDEKLSLSKLYSLKTKLSESLSTKVYLKSGGFLVINKTEALTIIDVNSGKNTPSKKAEKEETALSINIEAASEIALLMKLRNISGIILIDFINMDSDKDKEVLLEKVSEFTAKDKVYVKVIDITPLGIMELTRQKTDKPIEEIKDALLSLFP